MDLQTLETVYGVGTSRWVVKKQFESGNRFVVGFGSVARDYSLGGGYVTGYRVRALVRTDDTVAGYYIEELEGYEY